MHPALSQRFTNPAPGEGSLFIQASPVCAGASTLVFAKRKVMCNVMYGVIPIMAVNHPFMFRYCS